MKARKRKAIGSYSRSRSWAFRGCRSWAWSCASPCWWFVDKVFFKDNSRPEVHLVDQANSRPRRPLGWLRCRAGDHPSAGVFSPWPFFQSVLQLQIVSTHWRRSLGMLLRPSLQPITAFEQASPSYHICLHWHEPAFSLETVAPWKEAKAESPMLRTKKGRRESPCPS